MKKIISLFIIMLLIFPIKISAINISPKIECSKLSLKAGENTECDFSLDVSEGKISAISASYSFDSNVSMIVVRNSENWQGNADGNQIDYYDYRDYTNHVPIAKFIYNVKDTLSSNINSYLKINVIEVADEYGNANILNYPLEVNFNLIKANVVTTTAPVTTNVSTTKKETTTYKKKTTTKNNTTVANNQTTTINEITTTSTTLKSNKVTTKKTTFKTVQKVHKKNPIIIGSLLLFLILIIIAIIIIIKEEQKRKQYEE